MSRLLPVPAVVCLVLGLVLGVWGWGERDEARARIVPEEEGEDDGLFFPTDDVAERQAEACQVLLAVSRLEVPAVGSVDPAGATTTTLDPGPVARASAIAWVLDPVLVGGIPALDRPDVLAAMDRLRVAVEQVQLDGGEVTTDPDAADASQILAATISDTC